MASSLASCAGHHHHTAATIDVGSLADCLSSDKLGYSLGAGRSCHCNSCCDRHFSCIESELGTEIQFVPHHIFSRIPRSIATTVSKLLNDQVGSNSCHLVGFGQASHPASLSQSCSKDKYPVKTVILQAFTILKPKILIAAHFCFVRRLIQLSKLLVLPCRLVIEVFDLRNQPLKRQANLREHQLG